MSLKEHGKHIPPDHMYIYNIYIYKYGVLPFNQIQVFHFDNKMKKHVIGS